MALRLRLHGDETKQKRNENGLASNRFQTFYTRTADRFEPFTRKRKMGEQGGVSTCWLAARAGSDTLVGVGTCGGRKGWVFPAKYSPAANVLHDLALFPIAFLFTRERKRFEPVWKTFQNTVFFHFGPFRYRFGRYRVTIRSKRNDLVLHCRVNANRFQSLACKRSLSLELSSVALPRPTG